MRPKSWPVGARIGDRALFLSVLVSWVITADWPGVQSVSLLLSISERALIVRRWEAEETMPTRDTRVSTT